MCHWLVSGVAAALLWPAAALADGEWSDGPRLQDPRSGLAAIEFEGQIYAAGGAGLTQPRNEVEQWLVATVQRQAQQAGIGMPEVAVYDAPEINAFATGAFKNDPALAERFLKLARG